MLLRAQTANETPAALFERATKYEGCRIVAPVQFEPADQPLTRSELQAAVPFGIGSSFEVSAIRQAIQNLYATGRFSDIAVDVRPEPAGVVVRFVTRRAYFVGRVVLAGVKPPPNTGELASATKLRLGYPFHDADAVQATESLQALLRSDGFYRPDITRQISFDTETDSANLAFDVATGPRARFAEPLITGVPERSDQSIIRATHWQRVYGLLGWQQVTQARIRQGLENLRRYYEKHNLLNSRVTLARLEYNADTNTVTPTIDVRSGTKVSIEAPGAHISERQLKQLIPIFEEHSLDPDLLLEGQR
ncbi:MAG: hypothetical protein JO270_05150, partial [Acidobacteriaceae bacterium]|nr:hypothetical protein [Acidobacteriaceae bacterium]